MNKKEKFLSITLFLISLLGFIKINALPDYNYYFFVPENRKAALIIVSQEDDTVYTLYNITGNIKEEVDNGKLSRMEKKTLYSLIHGVYRLATNKRVTAFIALGTLSDTYSAENQYIGSDGKFISKNFLIVPFSNRFFWIVAYEDSNVKFYDSSGKLIKQFKLWKNESRGLIGQPGKVYNIVSDGYISVIVNNYPGVVVLKGADNTIKSNYYLATLEEYTYYSKFVAIPYAPCKVLAANPVSNKKILEHDFSSSEVSGGGKWESFYTITNAPIKFVGDKPFTLMLISNSKGGSRDIETASGIDIFSILENTPVKIYVSKGDKTPSSAIIIAVKKTKILVDGIEFDLMPGSYISLTSGLHELKSDNSVIIEVIYDDGNNDVATLISDKDLGLRVTSLRPSRKSKAQEGFDLNLVALLVVIVIIVVIFIIFMKKRGVRK